MIPHTIFEKSSGRITALFATDIEGDLALNTPDGCDAIEGHHQGDTHYIDCSDPDMPAPTARPAIRSFAAGKAPLTLDLDHIPPGSVLTVENEDGDAIEITTFNGPLTLTDPGIYSVRIAAAFPAIDLAQELEVI